MIYIMKNDIYKNGYQCFKEDRLVEKEVSHYDDGSFSLN
jgi:hypothetical protein